MVRSGDSTMPRVGTYDKITMLDLRMLGIRASLTP